MKALMVVPAVLMLMACSHSAPPPVAPEPLTCQHLYWHIVEISIRDVFDHHLSSEAMEAARMGIDRRYQETGKTRRFYAYCDAHATQQQLSCALQATTRPAITLCFAP